MAAPGGGGGQGGTPPPKSKKKGFSIFHPCSLSYFFLGVLYSKIILLISENRSGGFAPQTPLGAGPDLGVGEQGGRPGRRSEGGAESGKNSFGLIRYSDYVFLSASKIL